MRARTDRLLGAMATALSGHVGATYACPRRAVGMAPTSKDLAEQRSHGDLRPAFELVEACEDVGDGAEASALDVGFAGAEVRFGDVAEVDHAEVDLADGSFIIVDEAHDGFVVGRVDDHFFLKLAAHALAVDVVAGADFGVDRRNVSADADAALRAEPGLAAAAAAL